MGQKQRSRRVWASTRAPLQPLFGIQVARHSSSRDQGAALSKRAGCWSERRARRPHAQQGRQQHESRAETDEGDRGDGHVTSGGGGVGGVGGEAFAAVHRGAAVQPIDIVGVLSYWMAAGPETGHHQREAEREDVTFDDRDEGRGEADAGTDGEDDDRRGHEQLQRLHGLPAVGHTLFEVKLRLGLVELPPRATLWPAPQPAGTRYVGRAHGAWARSPPRHPHRMAGRGWLPLRCRGRAPHARRCPARSPGASGCASGMPHRAARARACQGSSLHLAPPRASCARPRPAAPPGTTSSTRCSPPRS
eukprot:scaffold17060_cov59-Phaeocystis_antarctica.AAC.3